MAEPFLAQLIIVRDVTRVLATILAHPDDETFGTGGTLIRYASEGFDVHSLCLTEGEQGWAGGEGAPVIRASTSARRARSSSPRRAGGWVCGAPRASNTRTAGSPVSARSSVIQDIVRWLRAVRPDVVITWGPDGGRYGHPNHIAAGERALRAIDLRASSDRARVGDHVHVKRVYRFVASADLVDLEQLVPEFADYIATLAVKPSAGRAIGWARSSTRRSSSTERSTRCSRIARSHRI